jgi:hypothetical protein
MENLTIIQAVTDELVKRGYRATMEHPGYVEILRYGLRFDFGTANEKWDGDVEAYDSSGVVGTDIASDSTDVQAIADAIVKAVESCGPEDSVTRPANLTPVAQKIFEKVIEAMQEAEGLLWAPVDYEPLMQAIANEAQQRITNYREVQTGEVK